MQTNMLNKDLRRQIVEISYKYHLSHLGSCLSVLDILVEIFQKKKPGEPVILSNGHSGLALYCCLEKYNDPSRGRSAEEIFAHHGVHPDRCKDCGIDCSTGSLGLGITLAVGMALADRTRGVWCVISDGELAEGSLHEALRIAVQYELKNLHVYLNDN